jgi:dipeptidyl aminopeptidase/acylaminoacyl peptidase
VCFSHYADHRWYRLDATGGTPRPLTPDDGRRYADAVIDRRRGLVLAVCEDHRAEGEAQSTLVRIDLDGSGVAPLVSGHDFYANPRVSPDGTRLTWLAWRHPNMPWDGTELWLAHLESDGTLRGAELVAGGAQESIFQPEWSPSGVLHFISDRSGWWNLYRLGTDGAAPLCPRDAEFGVPQWAFGASTYAFLGPERIVCARAEGGRWRLAMLDTTTGVLTDAAEDWTDVGGVAGSGGRLVFVGGSATAAASLVELDAERGTTCVLRPSSELVFEDDAVSVAEPVTIPVDGAEHTHALLYRPRSARFAAPLGAKPPLLVKSHGGPTAAASSALDPAVQFWTSRGFALLDVDYRGSTGYGRAYRQRLDGQWGVVDVADCCAAAAHAAAAGWVDRARLAIRGSSAGGYTTLCALTLRDVFHAGAVYYGISDLEALANETHKFESRYTDRLVAPWPSGRTLYRERSPIHAAERLSCPVIFFQGLDDRVVPPDQAEAMVAVLREKGLPVAYVSFPGEGHGFRQAETIRRALEAELAFYGRVFGFTPAGAVAAGAPSE